MDDGFSDDGSYPEPRYGHSAVVYKVKHHFREKEREWERGRGRGMRSEEEGGSVIKLLRVFCYLLGCYGSVWRYIAVI